MDCDHDHEPDLFWALRGAGGGPFGVVTALRFGTVPEPVTTRIEAHWPGAALGELVTAWQAWAPDAPDELTVNLTLESDPGAPVQATLFGAATLEAGPTRELVQSFLVHQAGVTAAIELRAGAAVLRPEEYVCRPAVATRTSGCGAAQSSSLMGCLTAPSHRF